MALGAATPAVTVHHYTYDGLGRLTQEALDGGTTTDYAYDPVGNRTGVWVNGTQTMSRAYNDANQVVGWTYDAAGNLLGDGTQQHTWDALNRLTQTQDGSNVTMMHSNGDGVLVAQTQAGVTTRYVQDLAAPLSQMLSVQQGSVATTAIYGMGAERLAMVTDSAWRWPLVDALGTPKLTLDSTGAPLAAGQYDAWGVPSAGTVPDPFGFTGELHDPDTSLVYLRTRWYQPGEGVLLGRDPFAGYEQQPYSLHPYQYAYAQPTVYTDPSGYCVSGDTACEQVFTQVVTKLGFEPHGLAVWDRGELDPLNQWLDRGIRFTPRVQNDLCVPIPIGGDFRLLNAWSAADLSYVLTALQRTEQVVGRQKLISLLNLQAGTLTFNLLPTAR